VGVVVTVVADIVVVVVVVYACVMLCVLCVRFAPGLYYNMAWHINDNAQTCTQRARLLRAGGNVCYAYVG